MLDHGVCSGLILLNFATFYFSAVALASTRPDRLTRDWVNHPDRRAVPYSSWWNKAVWGTGAAAVHNITQLALKAQRAHVPHSDVLRYPKIVPLSLKEDPIAYLGLLVDILQDWDRYSSRRGAYVLQRGRMAGLPLQNGEVFVKGTPRGLVVRIEHDEARERIRKELDQCLNGYKTFLRIE